MTDATTTPVTPTDPDRDLWDAWEQTLHDLTDADMAVQMLATKEQALLSADTVMSINDRLSLLDGIEAQKADLNHRLAMARNRVLILGDETHRLKVQGRGRQVADVRGEITIIEARQQDRDRQVNEHIAAIQVLKHDGVADDQQVRVLVNRAAKLEPRPDRTAKILVATADPFRTPTDLLIRPSVWHAFIRTAQRRGLTDAQITVNELDGTIVRSTLDG